MPIRQGNTATNLLNFAPGINSSAYGGDASSGNGLLIDGVDTRDLGRHRLDLLQLQHRGGGAVHGHRRARRIRRLHGRIVNTITKSGGNRFAGLFDAIYTKSSFASSNAPADAVARTRTWPR
jgi:hypothetical protein